MPWQSQVLQLSIWKSFIYVYYKIRLLIFHTKKLNFNTLSIYNIKILYFKNKNLTLKKKIQKNIKPTHLENFGFTISEIVRILSVNDQMVFIEMSYFSQIKKNRAEFLSNNSLLMSLKYARYFERIKFYVSKYLFRLSFGSPNL